jgi:hypothetical protein
MRPKQKDQSLIEHAVETRVDREDLDRSGAFGLLRTSVRSSGAALIELARLVVGGLPLPSDRLAHARPQRRDAIDLEVALHRRDSELHEGEARRYERRGETGRAQTKRLHAAAARGRNIDGEAERRRADQAP